VVDRAHVPCDVLADLPVLPRLGDPLDPEVRHHRLLPTRGRDGEEEAAADGLRCFVAGPARGQQIVRRAVERVAELLPGSVEACGPEVALRREVAVEERLADPCLARDLRGCRARVASGREHPERCLDDRPPPLVRGEASRTAHAASAGRCTGSAPCERSCGRMRAAAVTAPASAMTEATTSASSNPSMNDAVVGGDVSREAMIAPIRAMPVEPPTCRQAFRTAEPIPAFSTGTARIAAAELGVIVIDMPNPPSTSAGRSTQNVESAESWLKYASWTARSTMPPVISQREPQRSDARPASGAIRMIRTVIGRNAAPASTAEYPSTFCM